MQQLWALVISYIKQCNNTNSDQLVQLYPSRISSIELIITTPRAQHVINLGLSAHNQTELSKEVPEPSLLRMWKALHIAIESARQAGKIAGHIQTAAVIANSAKNI